MASERAAGQRRQVFAPTRVEEVYDVLSTSTEPVKIRTDAGLAYLKHPANRSHPQSLACEWLGTRLAQQMDLTTFDTVQLDYDGAAEIRLEGGVAGSARCFVTRAEKGTTWDATSAGLDDIDRPDDPVRLLVLDTWLRNPDRHVVKRGRAVPNVSNVYVSHERGTGKYDRLIAMDHSQLLLPLALGPGGVMSPGAALDDTVYGLFPEFVPHLRREAISKALGALADTNLRMLLEILAEIPDDWGVDSSVRNDTVGFLLARATFLREGLLARLEGEYPTQLGIVEER